MKFAIDQVLHAAFPDVAAALRARIDAIVDKWDVIVRDAIPQMDRLTLAEMRDSFPRILLAVAAALESADPRGIEDVVKESPVHGLTRFYQNYGVIEVSQENRLLRAVIVLEIEDYLHRQTSALEAAALHGTLDVMILQAVMALVDEKQRHLSDAAERELKYLTFMSHDMNNQLSGVTLHLKLLEQELTNAAQSPELTRVISAAMRGIDETARGMRQLLDHESLRKGSLTARMARVDLSVTLNALAAEFAPLARDKDLELRVNADHPCIARTDPGLLSLIVRNLIGNAVKYAKRGRIQIDCRSDPPKDAAKGDAQPRLTVSVADQGPGISPEHLEHLFEPFRRGDAHGQAGVGLGLAIASQAAKLLNAQLTVESQLGQGTTFHLRLPPE